MRVIFMGTPEFAVNILEKIIEEKFNVVAVITVPDKPAGRGLELHQSPVKKCALKYNIPLLQPDKLKDESFIEQLRSFQADVQVVVAFRMLPEVVWSMPAQGTFNLHASLLPQYRGAAPINRAIMNGEKESGVTTFFLQHEIDTGNIIFQEKLAITDNETAGSLHDKLMLLGANLVCKTLSAINNDAAPSIPQNQIPIDQLRNAPKIFKNDCKIDWSKDTHILYNHIRGLSPYPAAWTELATNDKKLSVKIFQSSIIATTEQNEPGSILSDGKNYLHVFTSNGLLSIDEIQLEGKKRLPIVEFLRGYQFSSAIKFI